MAESNGSGLAGVLIGALLVGVVLVGVLFFTGVFEPKTAKIQIEVPKIGSTN